jgi:hypothetical protein
MWKTILELKGYNVRGCEGTDPDQEPELKRTKSFKRKSSFLQKVISTLKRKNSASNPNGMVID